MRINTLVFASILITLCLTGSVNASVGLPDENIRKTLRSPDGNYEFNLYRRQTTPNTAKIYYTLSYKGKQIIHESELGIRIENGLFEAALGIPSGECVPWTEDMRFKEAEFSSESSVWRPVYGERSEIRDSYNQCVLSFVKGDEAGEISGGYDKRRLYQMDIIVRAYDEGVAFRYHFPETANGTFLHITDEESSFRFEENTMAWYERWAQGPYELRPLSAWEDESERPLTLKLRNGMYVSLLEAGMTDYARTKFRLADDAENTLVTSIYGSVDVITPYSSPWRVIMAAEHSRELVENNDIILNLNPPCAIEDTSWIRPGKVFRSDLTQEKVIQSIDFAESMGLQYVHLDSGWYGSEIKVSSDATTTDSSKNLDMEALCEYAESKGIGLWVYVNQRALVNQLDRILPVYKKWGIRGIKFGFVQVGNQHWTTWLHEAVGKCAEYGLMVDIHDEYRPTGFSRTYPNLMTQEGIRGNEEMPDATHNVTLPYTRFLAGAADYTLCYFNSRKRTTYAHQLAMAVVYYSPIQFLFWYDNPDMYCGEQELEFWKNVPTVWDDTRVLDGDIGEFIITARRHGNEWFVGAMTNNEARSVTICTDFLEEGKTYRAGIYEDDDKLDTRTKVRTSYKTKIRKGDKFTFALKGSGGAAMHFVPESRGSL